MAQSPRERARAARDARLRAQYNISADEWDAILSYQLGICPICQRSKNGKTGKPLLWNTDHDHKDGLTRGILCVFCNKQLREFWTLEKLQAAVVYLTHPPAVAALGEARYGRKGRVTRRRIKRRKKK